MTTEATPPESQPPAPPSDWAAPPPAQAGPAAGLRYGGFWVRFLAIILDGIVIGVITSALAVFALGGTTFDHDRSRCRGGELHHQRLRCPHRSAVLRGLLGLARADPGMIPFNMRIVMADDGSKPDWVRMLLRYVGLLIGIVIFFLGVIWAGFDRRKQGWHDKMAGTVVVRPA